MRAFLVTVDPAFQSGVPVALTFTILFVLGLLIHISCSLADRYVSTYHHIFSVGWEIGLGMAVFGFLFAAVIWVTLPW